MSFHQEFPYDLQRVCRLLLWLVVAKPRTLTLRFGLGIVSLFYEELNCSMGQPFVGYAAANRNV